MKTKLVKQPLGDVFYLGIYGTEEQIQEIVNWFYNIGATEAKQAIDNLGSFGFISFQTKKFIRKLAWSWHSKAMELVPTERYSRDRRKRIAWVKAVRMAIKFYRELPVEKIIETANYFNPNLFRIGLEQDEDLNSLGKLHADFELLCNYQKNNSFVFV